MMPFGSEKHPQRGEPQKKSFEDQELPGSEVQSAIPQGPEERPQRRQAQRESSQSKEFTVSQMRSSISKGLQGRPQRRQTQKDNSRSQELPGPEVQSAMPQGSEGRPQRRQAQNENPQDQVPAKPMLKSAMAPAPESRPPRREQQTRHQAFAGPAPFTPPDQPRGDDPTWFGVGKHVRPLTAAEIEYAEIQRQNILHPQQPAKANEMSSKGENPAVQSILTRSYNVDGTHHSVQRTQNQPSSAGPSNTRHIQFNVQRQNQRDAAGGTPRHTQRNAPRPPTVPQILDPNSHLTLVHQARRREIALAQQQLSPVTPTRAPTTSQPALQIAASVVVPPQPAPTHTAPAANSAPTGPETIVVRGFMTIPLPLLDQDPMYQARIAMARGQTSWPPPANAAYDAVDQYDVYYSVRNSPGRNQSSADLRLCRTRSGPSTLSRGNSEGFSTATNPATPELSTPASLSAGGANDGVDQPPPGAFDEPDTPRAERERKRVSFARDDQIFSIEDEQEDRRLEFCGKCKKRHIVPGPPKTLGTRDTCLSMLPDWWPKDKCVGKEWEVFMKTTTRYVNVCEVLAGVYNEHSTVVKERKFDAEYHNPSPAWAEVGRRGGWWHCKVGSSDPLVPAVERDCRVCRMYWDDNMRESSARGKILSPGRREIAEDKVEVLNMDGLLREKEKYETFVRLETAKTMKEDMCIVLERIRTTGS